MRTLYLRKDDSNSTRKILIDMAYLVSHKAIRLPKYYFEDDLYLPYKRKSQTEVEKFLLTKNNILSEDENFYYFKFPFKAEEVVNVDD